MKIRTLKDLFTDELSDIMDAEKRISEALPKMAESCSDSALSDALISDANEASKQAEQIDGIMQNLALERPGETCEATQGLIEEAEEYIEDIETGHVLDAALITAAQKIKHYEIAGYGSLCSIANTLGYTDEAELLHETLEKEKRADQLLTELAKGGINEEAAGIAA